MQLFSEETYVDKLNFSSLKRRVFLSVLNENSGLDRQIKGRIKRKVILLNQRSLSLKKMDGEAVLLSARKEVKKREYFLLLTEIYSIADYSIGIKDENIMNLVTDFDFFRLPSDECIFILGDFIKKNQLLKNTKVLKHIDSSLYKYFDCLRIDFKDLVYSCNWYEKRRCVHGEKIQALLYELEKEYKRVVTE